jgi:tyrosinase
MRLLAVAAAALVGSVSAIKVTEHDKLAALGLENVAKDVAKYGYPRPGTCKLENAAVRKEWYVCSPSHGSVQLNFIKVDSHNTRKAELHRSHSMHPQQARSNSIRHCLGCEESLRRLCRNARSANIRRAWNCALTQSLLRIRRLTSQANFLVWHRYFIYAYEQLLRSECGLQGYLPYYNWAWWHEDPANSPLFDGSATSIGSGGTYVPGRNYTCVPNDQPLGCPIKLPPGSGGGCITGPLSK